MVHFHFKSRTATTTKEEERKLFLYTLANYQFLHARIISSNFPKILQLLTNNNQTNIT